MTDTTPLPPRLRLAMPALPANVAIVRQVLAGLADGLDVDPAMAADMKIAVTEACTNVVLHAYPRARGVTEITMTTLPGYLVLSVRDRGAGFKPPTPVQIEPERSGARGQVGFGLALIASLSDEFSIMSGAAGTEVQMLFTLGEQPPPDAARVFAGTSQLAAAGPEPEAGERLVLALGPGTPSVPVLGRLVSLLAARAGFSIDRLSDAQLVSDALATHAPPPGPGRELQVEVTEHDRAFDLHVGPLPADGGRRLVADSTLPGVGPLLERLSDELSVEKVRILGDAAHDAEMLTVRLSQD